MDKKTFIDKLKSVFSEIEKPVEEVVEEIKLVEIKTIDGVTLRIKEDELAEGIVVYVVDEEGNETVAPEGTHETEEVIIKIDAEGVITSIEDKEVEEEVTEEVTEDLPVEMEVIEEVTGTVEDRLSAIEKGMVDLSEAIANLSKVEEAMSAISNLEKAVIELSALPAEKEIKLSKATDKETLKKDRESVLKFLSNRK
jgi:hypothetical protein